MTINIKFSLLIIMFFLLFSCQKYANKEHSYILFFYPDSSSVSKPFNNDSILITYYGKDSIIVKNYYHGNYYQNIFFQKNGSFAEKRFVANFPEQIFEIDTILTLTKKDTSFVYHSNRDNFIVTLVDLSLFDSRYTISKERKKYKTIKQSLVDTTYKEIFFYDKDYNIYKFINTWKGNKCVYVKKK